MGRYKLTAALVVLASEVLEREQGFTSERGEKTLVQEFGLGKELFRAWMLPLSSGGTQGQKQWSKVAGWNGRATYSNVHDICFKHPPCDAFLT